MTTNGKGGFIAAALGRCPVCGQGKLFKSYLKVAETCKVCATDFKAADTGDGPVVFVILIAGFAACAGLLISFLAWNWSPATLLAVWPAFAVILSLILMPILKGLMVAAQIRHKIRD
ncbi:hypothetical protein ABI_42890 [Asticcacaulis biprosthecium C19]|uniref:DUF983 domain-containing protein n=1 Tax=Asticcacaulis biprosthecium C19 TaxID=715226 RepID=F4QSZ6_9CAUL|nr:DUF983 domain-containing protein [Asticcacaulis biprosthecium]EGF89866.1 hypothetical protein ABI_42890 [Asticcacaulis biprosthecium C19]